MRNRAVRLLVLVLTCLLAAGCASILNGFPRGRLTPNASIPVHGDSHGPFDTTVKNALSDVISFWRANYPKVANGKPFPRLRGGFYSVDGATVLQTRRAPRSVAKEACLAKEPSFVVDNAAYCTLDDSVIWDRSDGHLVPVLATHYGPTLVALVFAHEFGHAIQARLGITQRNLPTIDTESQADCAAGAFIASAIAGHASHFPITTADLDTALSGYLLVRDSTPESPQDISHGNGFDRLSALEDGIQHGVSYCYRPSYFNRQFTERPYVSDSDYLQGGNEPLSAVLNPNNPKTDKNAGGLQPNLNTFWAAAGKRVNKSFKSVSIKEASAPKCGGSTSSRFGYCPDDNTVYYDHSFASKAYYSLPTLDVNPGTAEVTVAEHQPADFALGTLFAVGWGMAARHQFFNAGIDDRAGLLAAICYTGSYAKSINKASGTFVLSPPDMDEATYAILDLVGSPQAYGARGTTGLQRIQAFVKGYFGDLSSC
jgi:predicted metalloprotease